MRVSELSERSGVPVHTIKYYVREGLLPAGERVAGRLSEYDEEHLRRLRLLRALREVGGVPVSRLQDVVAVVDSTASVHTMMGATADALAGEPVTFATNRLTIVVPPQDPGGVGGAADLARVPTVTCAPQVPCGALARELLDDLGVTVRPVSEEQSVKDVLGKVAAGEADAGLVYVSDARAAGDRVRTVDLARSADHLNRYRVAAVDGGDPELAGRWLDLVTGPEGREVLTDAGLGVP